MRAQPTNPMRNAREFSERPQTPCANGAIHPSLGQRHRNPAMTSPRAVSPAQSTGGIAKWIGLSALAPVRVVILGRGPRLVWIAPLAHRQANGLQNITPRFGTISARSLLFSRR